MLEVKDLQVGIVGCGYVGFPLAMLFAGKYKTVTYDRNLRRVHALNKYVDVNGAIEREQIRSALDEGRLVCTTDPELLRTCNFYIIAVPTPVDEKNSADLRPLEEASKLVGAILKKGDVVVYESTVYPGLTEDFCVPILQYISGLTYNQDFFVGYSPERVNPGDKEHTVEKITKVTSGSTPQAAELIDQAYDSVLLKGTFRASSIKIAEASKIVENCQRDILISFMNELLQLFDKMGLDMNEVIRAASTKWNFVPMQPGLVGGHCIAVDPYYLIEKAKTVNVKTPVLCAAREINDGMGEWYAQKIMQHTLKRRKSILDCKILILGFTFKPNCPDIRNTQVVHLYRSLAQGMTDVTIFDPWVVEPDRAWQEYQVEVVTDPMKVVKEKFDIIAVGTNHDYFQVLELNQMLKPGGFACDLKGILAEN